MTWFELSEDVLILKSEETHSLATTIQHARLRGVIDTVVTDEEIAIQYDQQIEAVELVSKIEKLKISQVQEKGKQLFELPVCYELGEDLDEVLKFTGLDKEGFIKEHLSGEYQAAYGFIPGFLYLSGLPTHLHCPRKQTPRTKLPAGSVGIGGNKTGVYSLESPGGWQIIGRTPLSLFDIEQSPPALIADQTLVKFVPISKDEFENWDGNT